MSLDYKAKYYEIRRAAKELVFENHALQNEIVECKQKICQRERERELLLQHLLEYEQEEWELQREMNNASTEKHKSLKKQQEADKRKRIRADTTPIIEHTPTLPEDTTGKKIPKIKIVFQQKFGPQETPKAVASTDINSDAKMAIKNKLKRNKAVSKLEPIVISLPTSVLQSQDKDVALQQLMKKHRPNSMLHPLSMSHSLDTSNMLPTSAMMMTSLASAMISSPSLVMNSASHLLSASSNSSLGLSPGFTPPPHDPQEILSHTSDNTPIDVFSESENSCNVSPSNSGSDASHLDNIKPDYKSLMYDDNSNSMTSLANETFEPAQMTDFSYISNTLKKSNEGFKISPSTLRNIKQKIDSINAKSMNIEQAMLKSAKSFNVSSSLSSSLGSSLSSAHQSTSTPKKPEKD